MEVSMNRQQAFDKALNGVRAQGYRKAIRAGGCQYLAEQGLRCGVGHMLSEEAARGAFGSIGAIMAGKYDGSKAVWPTLFKIELAGLDVDFLSACQWAHDSMLSSQEGPQPAWLIESFETHMQSIARDFGVTYTAPVQS
jgi:hypothetical protein